MGKAPTIVSGRSPVPIMRTQWSATIHVRRRGAAKLLLGITMRQNKRGLEEAGWSLH
jgi:hypothetical protein